MPKDMLHELGMSHFNMMVCLCSFLFMKKSFEAPALFRCIWMGWIIHVGRAICNGSTLQF